MHAKQHGETFNRCDFGLVFIDLVEESESKSWNTVMLLLVSILFLTRGYIEKGVER